MNCHSIVWLRALVGCATVSVAVAASAIPPSMPIISEGAPAYCSDASGTAMNSTGVKSSTTATLSVIAPSNLINGAFIKGANLAWLDGAYNTWIGIDPTEISWGCAYNSAHVNKYFADMHKMGITVVRIWINQGDEGDTIDGNDYVTGVTPLFWTNMDDCLKQAAATGVKLYVTLNNGRSDWLENTAQADAYQTNALIPMIKRYKGNPAIFAIDLMNEIDGAVAGNTGNWTSTGATWAQAEAYIKTFAAAIHAADPARLVSCSSGWHAWSNLQNFKGLGLDFYDFHQYDDTGYIPPASSLNMDKPIYVGECGQSTASWSDSIQDNAILNFFNNARDGGYAGIGIWDYNYPGGTDYLQMVNADGSWRKVCFTIQLWGATAPAFTTQPAGQTVIFGTNASFTAAASGTPTPTYQWQVSVNSSSTWTNLTDTTPYSGTATGTLSITGATMALNGHQYRCVASNVANPNVPSSAATLTVVKAVPVITWAAPSAITFGMPLSAAQLNATASVPGLLVYSPAAGTVLGAGVQTLNVSFTPNDTTDYTTATATQKLTVNKAVPAISWPSSATIPPGTTLSSTQLNAKASVPGVLVYAPAAGTVLSANTYSLKVTFTPTDTTDYATTTATQSLIVSGKTIPSITWPAPAAITYGKALSATQLNATASVPGAFVYTPAAGTVLSAGSQVLNVKFTPTNTTTYAATAGTQTVTVAKAAQAINFPAPGNKTFGAAPFNLWAAATSGQGVVFSVLSGPAKIYWNTVVLTGAGTVTLRASQAGNANYNAATPVDHSFTVAKAAQTITFGAPGNKVYGAAPFNLSASASSGLAVTFSVVSGPATIAGRTVTLTGAGTVTLQASQAGNANYNAATPVIHSFTVAKAKTTATAKADSVSKVAVTSNDDFLRQLFVNVLGRPINADELSSIGAAMTAGESRADVLGDLLASAEYSRRQIDPAIRLYYADFARVPAYADVQTCSSALASGNLTLAAAADQVSGSAEFQNQYGSLDNTQYVRQLYLNALGRDADEASLAGWVRRLDAGASRGAVLAALSQSAEFKADAADPVEILRLYFVLLHRIPTTAEFQGWEDFLQGADQADLAAPARPDLEDWLNDSAALDEQMREDLLADPAFTTGS